MVTGLQAHPSPTSAFMWPAGLPTTGSRRRRSPQLRTALCAFAISVWRAQVLLRRVVVGGRSRRARDGKNDLHGDLLEPALRRRVRHGRRCVVYSRLASVIGTWRGMRRTGVREAGSAARGAHDHLQGGFTCTCVRAVLEILDEEPTTSFALTSPS